MSNPNVSTVRNAVNYVAKHWFKFSVATLLLLLVFKRDLNFEVNIHPDADPAVQPAAPLPVAVPEREQRDQFSIRPTPLAIAADRASALDFGRGSARSSRPAAPSLNTVPVDVKEKYLQRFAKVAVAERKKYGIPASIILANALVSSTAGTFATATELNNQFALPCDEGWSGASAEASGHCFRKYENAWTSFRDHSNYLSSGRFADLKNEAGMDYRKWARGLEARDFSGQPNFAAQLVQIIEAYGLAELDK